MQKLIQGGVSADYYILQYQNKSCIANPLEKENLQSHSSVQHLQRTVRTLCLEFQMGLDR